MGNDMVRGISGGQKKRVTSGLPLTAYSAREQPPSRHLPAEGPGLAERPCRDLMSPLGFSARVLSQTIWKQCMPVPLSTSLM